MEFDEQRYKSLLNLKAMAEQVAKEASRLLKAEKELRPVSTGGSKKMQEEIEKYILRRTKTIMRRRKLK